MAVEMISRPISNQRLSENQADAHLTELPGQALRIEIFFESVATLENMMMIIWWQFCALF